VKYGASSGFDQLVNRLLGNGGRLWSMCSWHQFWQRHLQNGCTILFEIMLLTTAESLFWVDYQFYRWCFLTCKDSNTLFQQSWKYKLAHSCRQHWVLVWVWTLNLLDCVPCVHHPSNCRMYNLALVVIDNRQRLRYFHGFTHYGNPDYSCYLGYMQNTIIIFFTLRSLGNTFQKVYVLITGIHMILIMHTVWTLKSCLILNIYCPQYHYQ